jgi:hypothetical protein
MVVAATVMGAGNHAALEEADKLLLLVLDRRLIHPLSPRVLALKDGVASRVVLRTLCLKKK